LTVVVSDVGESEYFMGYFEDDAELARDVLEALSGVILLLDEEGVIGDASQHMKELSGFSVADVIGLVIRKLVPGCRPIQGYSSAPIRPRRRHQPRGPSPALNCNVVMAVSCSSNSNAPDSAATSDSRLWFP
jgi:PAS domain-containing protein